MVSPDNILEYIVQIALRLGMNFEMSVIINVTVIYNYNEAASDKVLCRHHKSGRGVSLCNGVLDGIKHGKCPTKTHLAESFETLHDAIT